MAKNWNLVPRVEPPELLRMSLAAARLDRMKLVLESEFEQHPVGTHRAPGAGSPQSQIMRHDEYLDSAGLELLFERPDIEFVGPGAAILMREIPERVCDCRRFEKILVLSVGAEFPQQRHADTPVHVYISNVDALPMQVAGHHLGGAAQGE